jgi:hypothetical protein
MNRYDVVNTETGAAFSYQAEGAMDPQPEWGQPEHQAPQLDGQGAQVLDVAGNPVMVTVSASYTVVVTDISYEWALAECREARAREYPSVGDQLDARFKAEFLGDNSQLHAIHLAIAAVKAKYPKPQAPQ